MNYGHQPKPNDTEIMAEIVRSVDGQIIGTIGNGVFTKRVQGSAHMLRTPPAWAIDCKAFMEAILLRSHTIRIEEQESGTIYEIGTDVFNEHKVHFKRKFGEQYFVLLKWWHEIRQGQKVLPGY